MDNSRIYVAYVDLLGIGDASLADDDVYHQQLHRFRLALCDAVDRHLEKPDDIFAFSDCAFASSSSLSRIGAYLMRLQYSLWEHNIFLKGAIALGKPGSFEFAALRGQSRKVLSERKNKLRGYWFEKEYVYPALLEKRLEGIAIQVDESVDDAEWLEKNVIFTCYFPGDSGRRPVVIRNLLVSEPHLLALEALLKHYMQVSHSSRRHSRYYVPLIITWLKSWDYSKIEIDLKTSEWNCAPLPLRQLILNSRVASEVTSLVGGDMIFYALLAKVASECTSERVTERVFDFISNNKRLRAAAEFVPDEICPLDIRRRMIDSRIEYLFKPTK